MEDRDEINNKLGQIAQWQVDHQKKDNDAFSEINVRLDAQDSNISMLATKEDIKELVKKIDPVLEIYRAVILSRGFLTGLAGVIIAITAIGVGFTWLVNSVMNK